MKVVVKVIFCLVVLVKCLFDSSPPVSIEWFKGGVLIDESDSQVLDLHTDPLSSTIFASQLTVNHSSVVRRAEGLF